MGGVRFGPYREAWKCSHGAYHFHDKLGGAVSICPFCGDREPGRGDVSVRQVFTRRWFWKRHLAWEER